MSFTENLYLKRMIQQLHEENLKLKRILSEQFEFKRDVTTPHAPEGQKASLFRHAKTGQHIVVSDGGTVEPGTEGEVRGQFKETAVFPSDEFGNFTGNPLTTLSGHRDHGTVVRQFAAEMGGGGGGDGGEGAVDMPTNPFRVSGTYTSSQNHPKPTFGHPTKPKFVDLDNPNYPKRRR